MPRNMLFGERRLYERKSCIVDIGVEDNDKNFRCHMRNVSLGGAFIEPPAHFKPKIGKELTLVIPYRNRKGEVVVKARIARFFKDGFAIVFVR